MAPILGPTPQGDPRPQPLLVHGNGATTRAAPRRRLAFEDLDKENDYLRPKRRKSVANEPRHYDAARAATIVALASLLRRAKAASEAGSEEEVAKLFDKQNGLFRTFDWKKKYVTDALEVAVVHFNGVTDQSFTMSQFMKIYLQPNSASRKKLATHRQVEC